MSNELGVEPPPERPSISRSSLKFAAVDASPLVEEYDKSCEACEFSYTCEDIRYFLLFSSTERGAYHGDFEFLLPAYPWVHCGIIQRIMRVSANSQ